MKPPEMCAATGLWLGIESVRGQRAVASVWRARLGEEYPVFRDAFLRRTGEVARGYPCPRGCGCAHEVVRHGPLDIVGVCRCRPWRCADLALSPEEVAVWELSWPRFGRALCGALGLEAKAIELSWKHARQVGSWSAEAVPVILAVPAGSQDLRRVVAELAMRLRRRFILLAPTLRFLDVSSRELLSHAEAECYGLDQCVLLTRQGSMEPVKAPGELFARFQPPSVEVDEEVAHRAFALVKALDAGTTVRKAPLLSVFRLYCVEGLSATQVARQCRCARPVVFARLKLLRQKLGVEPRRLRRYSPLFERVEGALSDPRARRISRKEAAFGEEGEEA